MAVVSMCMAQNIISDSKVAQFFYHLFTLMQHYGNKCGTDSLYWSSYYFISYIETWKMIDISIFIKDYFQRGPYTTPVSTLRYWLTGKYVISKEDHIPPQLVP